MVLYIFNITFIILNSFITLCQTHNLMGVMQGEILANLILPIMPHNIC